MLRKAGNKDNTAQEGEMSDLSSDDDDDGASNDIDSDEVEEFIGKDDEVQDLDFAAQKDFIGFG